MKAIKTMTVTAVMTLLGATNAHAGGFLADTFIKPFSPQLAEAADRANAAAGNPVDHAIAGGLNAVVPGSGAVLEGAWAIQRSGVLNGLGQPAPMGQPMPMGQPGPFGQPGPIGFPQQPFPQQLPQLGNFCHTQAGRFGPGPINPLGMPCTAFTPYGPVQGMVGN